MNKRQKTFSRSAVELPVPVTLVCLAMGFFKKLFICTAFATLFFLSFGIFGSDHSLAIIRFAAPFAY